ncbi:MAG: hypothetical protein ACR2QW_18280 [bacterium]
MKAKEKTNRNLPSERAFVVQFHAAKVDGSTSFEGRIEHLTTGHSAFFSSQEELCLVIDKLLKGN